MTSLRALFQDRPLTMVLGFTAGLTLLRIILLFLSQSDLGPDEAQYWFWSRELAFGYYSKPPMIAWVIGLPTALFGDQEWAVRLLSPVLIGATAVTLFLCARRLYGDGPAEWTTALWLTLPVVIFGATIISTDIPLLLFWSLALLGLVGLAEAKEKGEAWPCSILLGVALGLGFLSKYAMVYFPLGWGVALIVSNYARRTWRPGPVLLAALIAGALFAPNLVWNANNGFDTLSHTADNANWGGDLINPDELLDFVGAQFGVVGPILFGCLLAAVIIRVLPGAGKRLTPHDRDRMMLAFVLPPLLIICGQALLSRAHANWAMAAYPAALIVLPVWMSRWKLAWLRPLTLGLHAAIGLFFAVVLTDFTLADRLGLSNSVKRVRGWEVTSVQIAEAAAAVQATAVLVDEREFAAHLVWEWRRGGPALMAYDVNGRPDNTYEQAFPFNVPEGKTVLVATQLPNATCAYRDVGKLVPAGESFVDLNATRRGRRERTIDLYTVIVGSAVPSAVCET